MNTQSLIAQATVAGDAEAVEELLQQSPELIHSHSQDGWTPLHLAAYLGHCAVAETLLRHGADVNAPAHNSLANTPILRAVMGQQGEMVTLLLKHGANVNTPNIAGSTPLHKAALEGNDSLVRLLLDHGAAVNARNTGGQTPLVHALYHGHTQIAALLEEQAVASDARSERAATRPA